MKTTTQTTPSTDEIFALMGREGYAARDEQRSYEAAARSAAPKAAPAVYWTDEARAELSTDLDRWEAEAAAEEAAMKALMA